jgi:hypothetical protein
MTTSAAGLAGPARSAAARAPFHCAACGEPLFTRARACPHCGAPDPIAADGPPAEERQPPLAAAEAPRPVPDVPASEAAAPELAVPDVALAATAEPDGAGPDEVPPAADAAATPAGAPARDGEPAYAELEPVEQDDAARPAGPRVPRPPTARLDIAPEPYEDDLSDARDLVLVPERGGRTVMLPEPPRRGRLLGVALAGLVVIGLGAAALVGWRMLAPPDVATAREMTVDTAWTPVELEGGAGAWVVTSDTPFRIRVDGAVYTVATPGGFAIPLGGEDVSVRAISGSAKVSFARR